MKAFVTGATGFIGTAVIEQLLAKNYEVTALVRNNASAYSLKTLGANPIVGDILELKQLPNQNPDAIFHLASAPTEIQGSHRYLETDVQGATNLVQAFPQSHLLYASSVWVYGSSSELLTESASLYPRTGLGYAKAKVESILQPIKRYTIFRIGMIYHGGSFGRQVIQAMHKGLYRTPGNGSNFLSAISISDVADAFVSAAERSITGIYNLVDDKPITWREMAAETANVLRMRPPGGIPLWLVRVLKGKDLFEYVNANLRISNEKAKAANFTLRFKTFAEGLKYCFEENKFE